MYVFSFKGTRFSPFFTREKTFVTFCLLSCTPSRLRKRGLTKEFAPEGNKFIPFRVDTFLGRGKNDRVASPKSLSVLDKGIIITKIYILTISMNNHYYRSDNNYMYRSFLHVTHNKISQLFIL